MKFLLDTHTLLWALADDKRLSPEAKSTIASEENAIFVSIATLWELKIKESLGKIKLPKNFYREIQPSGYELLNIHINHIEKLGKLPKHHRDPFDRMLISQSIVEELTLITQDQEIKKYKIKTL